MHIDTSGTPTVFNKYGRIKLYEKERVHLLGCICFFCFFFMN